MTLKGRKIWTVALTIFVVFSAVGLASPLFATGLPGLVQTTKLTVGDTSQIFAIADTDYLQGGHMQVPTVAAMESITPERRSVGMLVTVIDADSIASGNQTVTYRLTSNPAGPSCPASAGDTGTSPTSTVTNNSLDGGDAGGTGPCTYTVYQASGYSNWSIVIPSITSSNIGQYLTTTDGKSFAWGGVASGAGSGSVSSVGLALPSIFTVSGSPVTSAGTLTAALSSEPANTVFAGPASGSSDVPTFRALVNADLPTLAADTLLGNPTDAATTPTLITLGYGLAFNGTTLGLSNLPGTTWTNEVSPVAQHWNAVAYGNGMFVALNKDGLASNEVMTSPDGVNWTSQSIPAVNTWTGLAYGNGLFVAVASGGTTSNDVMTSPDGVHWTDQTSAAASQWNSVAYGNGMFAAVSTSSPGTIMSSPDGVHWTSRTAPAANAWWSVTYGNGKFVAVGAVGTTSTDAMYSSDGITWSDASVSTPSAIAWRTVTYGNGIFVALATTGSTSTDAMYSTDGITWSSSGVSTINAGQWDGLTYGNGVFVAVAFGGTSTTDLMTSRDGMTWTSQTSPSTPSWTSVAYGNGSFVSVGASGTTSNGIMISGAAATSSVQNNNIYQGGLTVNGTTDLTSLAAGLVQSNASGVLSTVAAPSSNTIVGYDAADNSNEYFALGSGLSYNHSTHTLSATGGGGGGGLAIGDAVASGADDEVLFADGSGDLAQSADFLFTEGTNPIFAVGDLTGSGSDTKVTLDDTTASLVLQANNFDYQAADGHPRIQAGNDPYVTLGDIDGEYGHGTLMVDGAESAVHNDVNAIYGQTPGGRSYLDFDGSNGNFRYGDLSGWGNGTQFDLIDGGGLASLTANNGFTVKDASGHESLITDSSHSVSIGDLDGAGNGTKIQVADSGESVTINGNSFTVNSNTGRPGLYINAGSQYQLGDITCITSCTSLDLDASAESLSVNLGSTTALYLNKSSDEYDFGADGTSIDLHSDHSVDVTGSVNISTLVSSNTGVVLANSSGNLSTSVGTTGQVLTIDGSGNAVWASPGSSAPSVIGENWVSQTGPATIALSSVAYGGGTYVAVGYDGSDPHAIMYSTDGVTWSNAGISGSYAYNWTSITYGAGTFVAVSDGSEGGGGAYGEVMTSSDGITWTLQTASADHAWKSVTYGGGHFVAVASGSTMYSSDGVTWTEGSGLYFTPAAVTYGSGTFVVVNSSASSPNVMYSTDGGTSWTPASGGPTAAWGGVAYGAGVFTAVSKDGSGDVMYSTAGTSWTTSGVSTPSSQEWKSVAFGGGLFVAVAQDGTTSNDVMYSTDGITWSNTSVSTPVANQWQSVAYGSSMFVAVANNGTTSNEIMTSVTSGGSGGSLAIGSAIGGGSANEILYTDDSGDLAQDANFRYSDSDGYSPIFDVGGSGSHTTNATHFVVKDTTSSILANAYNVSLGDVVGLGNSTDFVLNDSSQSITANVAESGSGSFTINTEGSPTLSVASGAVSLYGLYAFPDSNGSAGQVLKTDGAGNLSWVADATGTSLGSVWISRTSPVLGDWGSIAYGDGKFVAVGGGTSGPSNKVMYSADGTTWSTAGVSVPVSAQWSSVAYGAGEFVAVSLDGDVMSSPDGITWTAGTAAESIGWRSVVYGGGQFVVVGSGGSTSGDDVMYSSDGLTWSNSGVSVPVLNTWRSVAYGHGIYVAISNDGGPSNDVMISSDGITWTSEGAGTPFQGWDAITFGNGKFVAVSNSSLFGGDGVMSSSDGITWTLSGTSPGPSTWTSVTYGAGQFVAVSQSGSTTDDIMTSTDGLNWTGQTSPAANSWTGVAYGGGVFAAVSIDGTTSNDIMTSSSDSSSGSSLADGSAIGGGTPNEILFADSSTDLAQSVNLAFTNGTNPIFSVGDVAAAGHHTVFTLNDSTQTFNFSTGGTTELSVSPTGVTVGAGVTIGGFSGSTPGILTYNSTGAVGGIANVNVPGDILTIDGSGNPHWAAPGSATYVLGTWVNQTSPNFGSGPAVYNAVAYGGGRYVAVGSYISDPQTAAYSTDGVTWTQDTPTGSTGQTWNSVAYGDGKFVAVSTQGHIMTTTDGITWTLQTNPTVSQLRGVTFGDGIFVAVGYNGSSTSSVLTSPDGVTWTARTAAATFLWNNVVYGGGQFVATPLLPGTGGGLSGTNFAMRSSDGITWTNSGDFSSYVIETSSIAYGDGKYVITSSTTGGSNSIMYSTDGINWTGVTPPSPAEWNSVTYAAGQFVAVAGNTAGGTTVGNDIITSSDGITWTTMSSPGSVIRNWTGVTYGNNLFVAVAADGTTSNQIMTSPVTSTGGSGGGLTIGGAITGATPNEILYADSSGDLAQSVNLAFLDGTNPSFSVGDIAGAGNNTTFKLNDTTSTIVAQAAAGFTFQTSYGSPYLSIDTNAHVYSLGDSTDAYDGTDVTLDDNTNTVTSFAQGGFYVDENNGGDGTGTGSMLSLDPNTDTYSIGDLTASIGSLASGLSINGNTGHVGINTLSSDAALSVQSTGDAGTAGLVDFSGTGTNDLSVDASGFTGTEYTDTSTLTVVGVSITTNTETAMFAGDDVTDTTTGAEGTVASASDPTYTLTYTSSGSAFEPGDSITDNTTGNSDTLSDPVIDQFEDDESATAYSGTLDASTSLESIGTQGLEVSFASTSGHFAGDQFVVTVGAGRIFDTKANNGTTLFSVTGTGGVSAYSNIDESLYGGSGWSSGQTFIADQSQGFYGLGDLSSLGQGESFAIHDGGPGSADWIANLGDNLGQYLQVAPSSGHYAFGDISDAYGGTSIVEDDSSGSILSTVSSQFAVSDLSGDRGLIIQPASGGNYALGDIDDAYNGSSIYVKDSAEAINLTADNQIAAGDVAGDAFLKLDMASQVYSLGDISGSGGGTQVSVDDGDAEIDNFAQNFTVIDPATSGMGEYIGGGDFSFGDLSDLGNGTSFVLNDAAETVTAITDGSFNVNDTSSNSYLSIDPGSDSYAIGDLSGADNNTTLTVNDTDHEVEINGNVVVTGTYNCNIGTSSGGVTCTSDERLKKNITDLPSELANIDALRPVNYNWIDPTSPTETEIGFLAQDVQAIYPQFVHEVGNGYLGIDYASLITPAIKAIQELDMKVEPLSSLDVSNDDSLAGLIRQYLENALNGIGTIFVGKVQTNELCLQDVCVTKDQLQTLLNNAGASSAADNTGGGTSAPSTGGDSTASAPTDDTTGGDATASAPADDTTPSDSTATPPDSSSDSSAPASDPSSDSSSSTSDASSAPAPTDTTATTPPASSDSSTPAPADSSTTPPSGQ